MIGAYRHQTLANQAKVDAVLELFPAFREAMAALAALTHKELLEGKPLSAWRKMPADSVPFTHRLSSRQMKSAQNMVHTALASWQALLCDRVRKLVTGSEIDDARKTVLYRINARHSWWAKELVLPWLVDEHGELVVSSVAMAEKHPTQVVWLPVDNEDLALARALVKQAQKHISFPNLSRVNTLVLDSIVARPTRAKTATRAGDISWWVKTATLQKGHPVEIPLAHNPYFETKCRATGAKVCGAVQLHLVRDAHLQPKGADISLLLNAPDAEVRKDGAWLGIDFGLSSALFATSDGRLLGHTMLARLRELDAILTPYASDLQRRGIPLKTDPYYRTLQRRIKEFVVNEIGRLLNEIAARDGDAKVSGLVVERLDFRGGGLSRQMNRICTRAGRGVLKTRLDALTQKHGIAVVQVPAPYTSQECSGCGYVAKSNRRSQRLFICGFCHNKIHADINSSRVIRSRRSWARPGTGSPGHTGDGPRRITLCLLDSAHRKRWNLPAAGAVPGVAGALGQLTPTG